MDQESQRQSNPWATRQGIGFFKALWETIKQVLFSPGDFFANLEIERSHSNPLLFYFTIVLSATAFSLLWRSLLLKGSQVTPLQILLIPVIIAISLYVGAALIHLGVMIFKGKGGFRGTLNALSYGAAGRICSVVPFIGDLVGSIWSLIAVIIGLKKIHKFSTARAIFAYFTIALILTIPLLVAIAIPNLLRARMSANETIAQSSLKVISAAIEGYKTTNGNYPLRESDLTQAKPPYLNTSYNDKVMQGYNYSLNFSDTGYELVAEPTKCGTTGGKTYKIITGERLSQEACKR